MELELKDYFLLTVSLFRLIIVFSVFLTARRSKKRQMYILGLHFITEAATYIIGLSFLDLHPLVKSLVATLDILLILVFIKLTFSENKKGVFYSILGVVIVLAIINIVCALLKASGTKGYELMLVDVFSHSGKRIVAYIWLLYSAFSAFYHIKSDSNVEPWIKWRYIFVMIGGASGLIAVLTAVFLIPIAKELTFNPTFNIVMSCLFITVGSEYLAWVMPNFLKKFFNRNYKSVEQDEELDEIAIMSGLGGK